MPDRQKQAVWVPNTNDAIEGALGTFRQFSNRLQNAHTTTFSSVFMFVRNEAAAFAKELLANEANFLWVMREARRLDAQGGARNRRGDLNSLLEEKAEEKKREREEKERRELARRAQLADLPLERDFNSLKNFTVSQLRAQLEKHQLIDPENIRNRSGNKQELLIKLRAALDRYEANLSFVGPSASTATIPLTS